MKSLSTKTLQKKYIKAGISEEECALLRKYMLCFSNLYGSIQVEDLWNVFKQYKEKITKEKFFDFIDISQREENDYLILNLNEAYTGETSTETNDKFLVNKSLIKRFDLKFWYFHRLEEFKSYRYSVYIPSREELFKFDHDIFFESKAGKEMVLFISNLKASGFEYDRYDNSKQELLDLDGNSIKDKCFKDIVCYSHWEKFEINRCKKENQKEYLIEQNSITCAEKILNEIKRFVLIENLDDYADTIKFILNYINDDFGAEMSEEQLEEFLRIYTDLTNTSNRWTLLGWSSTELMKKMPIEKGPIRLQFGSNIQKMIDNGEYDLNELKRVMKENNIDVKLTKQNDENSYESIIDENNQYLDEFRVFLEKRNYRENVIDKHLSRVDYYINDYLMWGLPKHMEEGCSLEVIGFIENRVNEKVIPPSVHNIDFYLASISLFYEFMLEKKKISKEILKEFEEDIHNFKDEMIEDYYDKNPKEIDLYDVIQTIEEAHGYGDGYINIKTGEIEFVPEDESLFIGVIDDLYDKLDGPNWVIVPRINDFEIMTEFSLNLKDQEKSNRLHTILHNKKAYRNFKEAIYEMNIEVDYYDFYDLAVEELAKQWLDDIKKSYLNEYY